MPETWLDPSKLLAFFFVPQTPTGCMVLHGVATFSDRAVEVTQVGRVHLPLYVPETVGRRAQQLHKGKAPKRPICVA